MRFPITFLLLSILLPIFSASLYAQDAVEGNYEYMRKETAPGLSIVILGQPKSVEAVIENIFREVADEKSATKKGMMSFEKTRFSPISAERLNYYFTVEAPSRKDAEHSKVNLFMKNQAGDFVTSVNFSRTVANAKLWLADLELETKVYEMNLVIQDQMKLIEKEKKNRDNLLQDSVRLQEDLAKLKADITTNHQSVADQKAKVLSEQERLKAFEAKLKGLREERDILKEARKRAGTILNTGNNNR